MNKNKKPLIEADAPVNEDMVFTNFQYLQAKVEILEDELQLVRDILNQNNLVLKKEIRAESCIEDKTWEKLEID